MSSLHRRPCAWPVVTKTELRDLVDRPPNSMVEFKSLPIDGLSLARDLVAFANSRGGRILIGLDDGSVSGSGILTDRAPWKPHHGDRVGAHDELKDWIAATCRNYIRPSLVPKVEVVHQVASSKDVAVVTVDRSWTVHHVCHERQRYCYVRTGGVVREIGCKELAARLPRHGAFRLELRPVSGTSFADLDRRRLLDYFVRVREQEVPNDGPFWPDGRENAWEALLTNTLMLREEAPRSATVAALMLFGISPAARQDRGDCLPRRSEGQRHRRQASFAGPHLATAR